MTKLIAVIAGLALGTLGVASAQLASSGEPARTATVGTTDGRGATTDDGATTTDDGAATSSRAAASRQSRLLAAGSARSATPSCRRRKRMPASAPWRAR